MFSAGHNKLHVLPLCRPSPLARSYLLPTIIASFAAGRHCLCVPLSLPAINACAFSFSTDHYRLRVLLFLPAVTACAFLLIAGHHRLRVPICGHIDCASVFDRSVATGRLTGTIVVSVPPMPCTRAARPFMLVVLPHPPARLPACLCAAPPSFRHDGVGTRLITPVRGCLARPCGVNAECRCHVPRPRISYCASTAVTNIFLALCCGRVYFPCGLLCLTATPRRGMYQGS